MLLQTSQVEPNLEQANQPDLRLGFQLAYSEYLVRFLLLMMMVGINVHHVLRESEQHVLYGLSNAFGEVDRSFQLVSAQYNRLQAAKKQLEVAKKGYEDKYVTIDIVLEAQRRACAAPTHARSRP